MQLSLIYVRKIDQLRKSINKTKMTSLISENKITKKAIKCGDEWKIYTLQIDLSPLKTVNQFALVKPPGK